MKAYEVVFDDPKIPPFSRPESIHAVTSDGPDSAAIKLMRQMHQEDGLDFADGEQLFHVRLPGRESVQVRVSHKMTYLASLSFQGTSFQVAR